MSSPSSMGGPERVFADASSMSIARSFVPLSSFSSGRRASSHRPGRTWFVIAANAALRSSDDPRRTEHHRASVVQRVVESRPCHNDSVDDRCRYTDLLSNRCAHHSAGMGSVEVEHVPDAGMDRWNRHGTVVGFEREMADQCLVEDAVDRLPVVSASLGEAYDSCSTGWGLHRAMLPITSSRVATPRRAHGTGVIARRAHGAFPPR